MILPHLKFHIFTLACSTFHHTTIGYHNLKIRYGMDITTGFFNHSPMIKIMGVVVDKKNHFSMLDVTNQLQSLGCRKPNKAWREIWGSSQGACKVFSSSM
jgi:hypothetical protein